MDAEKIGKGIGYLRRRYGFTQRYLAELLCISDKAVSKWERGLSVPDVSLLSWLAIIFDTDIESLLERGTIAFPIRNHDAFLAAAGIVAAVAVQMGERIADLEEIATARDLIG
ncbi:helix-turn-helix domain-containing protein [Selenomonas bovis]|uniref:helix-turn-helix domain-containing protein n=1 Tax=Selenomonas bovis TaxID=416586 RepID=UPI003D07063A